MDPVRHGKKLVITTVATYQLQADGQARAPPGKGQVYRRQAKQSPAAAKKRIASGCQALRRLAGGAGGEQDVQALEQGINTYAPMAGDFQIGGMLSARYGHTDIKQLLDLLAQA